MNNEQKSKFIDKMILPKETSRKVCVGFHVPIAYKSKEQDADIECSAPRCHAKDSKIQLANGSTRRADEIEMGDELLCYGGKRLRVNNVIKGGEKELYHVITENGAKIKVSHDHYLLLEGGTGIMVERLKPGDKVMLAGSVPVAVLSVEKEPYNDTVYNFTFEGQDEGNYLIADGFYSGDFYIERMSSNSKLIFTPEELALIEEMRRLAGSRMR